MLKGMWNSFSLHLTSALSIQHCHDCPPSAASISWVSWRTTSSTSCRHEVHADLEQHLAECPRCVAQLKTYESTLSLLRSIRDEDLPKELRCKLKAFIDKRCANN